MNVGIIGAGEISQFHIPYTKENKDVHVAAVCDLDRSMAQGVAQKFDIPSVYDNVSEMLSEANLDVVHILTPPRSHGDLSLQVMEAGCHVLVEKPMALTVNDAKKMVEKARERKVKLSVCQVYLFDPMVIKARDLYQSGRLGELVSVEAYWFHEISYWGDAYANKGGGTAWAYDLPGNIFGNFVDHPMYLVQEYLQDIKSCIVKARKIGNNPFVPYDEVRIHLVGDKTDGRLVSSLNIKPPVNILKIYGTKMIVTVDISNMTLTTQETKNIPRMFAKAFLNLNQGYELISDTFRTTSGMLSGTIKPRQGLRTFLKVFYEALVSDKEPPVTGDQGLKTVQILSEVWKQLGSFPEPKTDKVRVGISLNEENLKIKRDHPEMPIYPSKSGAKRILVTGTSGFLGGHLVQKLLQMGKELTVITRKIDKKLTENPKIDIVYGDIRDINCLKRAVQGADIIYHCAGIVTNRGKWEHFQEINIDATKNLLDLSMEVKVNRLVYVSSVVVYGFKKRNGRNLITENDGYASNLGKWYYYAKSKVEADKLVLDYFKKFGAPVSIIRPGILYGPGKDVFSKGRFIIGQGSKLAPYAYVESVVDALILAGTKQEAIGQAYDIVDDQAFTQKQFLKETAKISNSKKRKVFVPKPIIYLGVLFFEYLNNRQKTDVSPPLSMYTIDTIRRDLIFDTTKAKKELGWRPKVSIEEGLQETFEFLTRQEG